MSDDSVTKVLGKQFLEISLGIMRLEHLRLYLRDQLVKACGCKTTDANLRVATLELDEIDWLVQFLSVARNLKLPPYYVLTG